MALKTSLIIDLAGNIQTRARQYGSALGGLASRGQAAMRGLQSTTQLAVRGLDKLGNRYTALLGGGAATIAVRGTMNIQEQLTRLGITADASDEIIKGLHNSILDAANAPDIRVDPSQILTAVESIMEKTGDLEFARANIRNIGLAIQASGADGAAIGDIFAEFQKQGMSAKDALASVDVLIAQGKAGAFTLKDLARLGPRVVTSYTALGRSGPRAMKEMGAALQLIRMGTGSSEEAATAWEAMLATFKDKKKLEFLQKSGVKVFDPEELKKGREVLRPINEIIKEVLQAAGKKSSNLSMVFDQTAIRAFNQALGELNRTGGLATLDQLMKIEGDGSTVQRDSARAAATANAALQSLKTTWGKFADSNLSGPIQKVADALNAIEPGRLETALDSASAVPLQIMEKCAEWGIDVFMHYSFPRHMAMETIVGRYNILKANAEALGIEFVDVTAPDPTGEAGTSGAQQFVLEDVPQQAAKYPDKKVAFFTTNCSMQPAMQAAILDLDNAYYPLPCCPSPYHGFPATLGLELELGDDEAALKAIAEKLAEHDAVGRFSTWPTPVAMSIIEIGVEYGKGWALGEITDRNNADILMELFNESVPGAKIENYTNAEGTTLNNYYTILLSQVDFNDYL